MKRTIYIGGFVVLGILLTTLLHAGIEMFVLDIIIISDSGRGIRFLSWEQWKMLHLIGSLTFLVAGFGIGLHQGMYWWKRVYHQR